MTLEVGRRWVNGRWTTDIENEGVGGSLPTGGTTGEVLTKASDADGDVDWEAAGGASALLTATVPVSSAEILALLDTPKVLIAAPGAGKYIWPYGVFPSYHYNTTTYVTANLEVVTWAGSGIEQIAPVSVPFIASPASVAYPWDLPINPILATSGLTAKLANKALVLTMDSGASNPSAGDGTLTFVIDYRIVDTSL